jgi:hypothetical protein
MQVGTTLNGPPAYTASRTDGVGPCRLQPPGNVVDVGFTNPPSVAGGRDSGGCALSLSLALCPAGSSCAEGSLLSSSTASSSGSRISLDLSLSTFD